MAFSLSISICSIGYLHNTSLPKHSIATPGWDNKNFTFLSTAKREDSARNFVISRVLLKNESSPIVSVPKEQTDKQLWGEQNTNAKEPERKIANEWKEIHGQREWAGMLDPIDSLLRSEVIRYGDMAQSCYDAFDLDPYSKNCGGCKIKPSMFFESLGWKHCGYEVTSYIYSTCNIHFPSFFRFSIWPDARSSSSNWIGYIAVSNDETSACLGRRDITISWRGTVTVPEKIADIMDILRPTEYKKIPSRDPTIEVEAGFLRIYTEKDKKCQFSKLSARDQVLAEVRRLIHKYKNEELSITITGHSLGAALAVLNAYDLAEVGVDIMDDGRTIPICVFSFSGPRVGNARFKERLEMLGVKVLRVWNIHDKVPYVPGLVVNEQLPRILQKIARMFPWFYVHVGEELPLDHTKSPFLKESSNLEWLHNLEVLLHLLDGYHGKHSRFWRASKRDVTLVNKYSGFLKDDFRVPPMWWRSGNRGLIKNHEGCWVSAERSDLEDDLPAQDL